METRAFGERVAAFKREIRSRSVDGIERRTFKTTLEVRAANDGGWQIVGHGIVYNSLSENLGGFREQIAEGAADGLLDDAEIAGLFNHDSNLVLGRVGAGTMVLEDNPPTGVRYTIDPPDTSYANDLRVSMERGDVYQSSFAFRLARRGDEWHEDEESGLLIRTIIKFSRLYDMSPVTYPAYPAADSGAKSARDAPVSISDGDRVAESFDDLSLGKRGTVVKTYADLDDGAVIHDVEWDDGSTGEGVRGFSLRRLDVPPLDRERNNGNEAAPQRPVDGSVEDEQAGGRSSLEEIKERMRVRIGEPPY